jgi:hypothetical protein
MHQTIALRCRFERSRFVVALLLATLLMGCNAKKQQAWTTLNKVYFLAQGAHKTICNTEAYEPKRTWKTTYDAKRIEAEELLSTLSLPAAESLKVQLLAVFDNLKAIGDQTEDVTSAMKNLDKGRIEGGYHPWIQKVETLSKEKQQVLDKFKELRKALDELKVQWQV